MKNICRNVCLHTSILTINDVYNYAYNIILYTYTTISYIFIHQDSNIKIIIIAYFC